MLDFVASEEYEALTAEEAWEQQEERRLKIRDAALGPEEAERLRMERE